MNRQRTPTEFGFTTSPYQPRERARPVWRTLVFGALLALIPIVGPGVSAVYIDRRDIPGTFDFTDALKTALIQVLSLFVIALFVALILTRLGFSLQPINQLLRAGGT